MRCGALCATSVLSGPPAGSNLKQRSGSSSRHWVSPSLRRQLAAQWLSASNEGCRRTVGHLRTNECVNIGLLNILLFPTRIVWAEGKLIYDSAPSAAPWSRTRARTFMHTKQAGRSTLYFMKLWLLQRCGPTGLRVRAGGTTNVEGERKRAPKRQVGTL